MSNGQSQTTPTNASDLMQAIQQLVANVGTATGSTGENKTPLAAMIPGTNTPPPQPTITFNPTGGGTQISHAQAPQRPGFTPTGSQGIGEFATKRGAVNAGLTSLGNSLGQLFGGIEQKEHAKKVALAENYMTQVAGFVASGKPDDLEKARMILEDKKILKTLKEGLEYVPVEEEVPASAQGVQSAVRKIGDKFASAYLRPNRPGQPHDYLMRRPALPHPSQEQELKSAMTNALLDKIRNDPASAVSMMGASQLSSAEQHADEFYKAGLGISPADLKTMTVQEKLQGLKLYEAATTAAIRGEVDLYRAQIGYKGKVDFATIITNGRKYVADSVKATKDKNGKPNNYAAGAKIYEDYAKKYLDIIKSGKGADGKPLTPEEIQSYQQKSESYQRQADEYLNQAGDAALFEEFSNALGETPDASTEPDDKQ